MAVSTHIALVAEAELSQVSTSGWRIDWPGGEYELDQTERGATEAWQSLAAGFQDRARLETALEAVDGFAALARFIHQLDRLDALGLLRRRLLDNGRPIADLCPLTADFRLVDAAGAAPVRFSRFATIRAHAGRWLLESPLGLARIELCDAEPLRGVSRWREPATAEEIADRERGLSVGAWRLLAEWLTAAALLAPVDPNGLADEDRDPRLRQWECHDLWFHARSRMGRARARHGATRRFEDVIPEPRATMETAAAKIDLARPPDTPALAHAAFEDTLEARRSIRRFGPASLDRGELGGLLHYAAGARRRRGPDGQARPWRTYPNGGARYELEVHLYLADWPGGPPGVYRYLPESHQLTRRGDWSADAQLLLDDAMRAAGATGAATLIVLAARFQRTAWAYESMAYALILKNAGALLHNFCLSATALGLGSCILGRGDLTRFSKTTGADWLETGSVAEILVGRPHESSSLEIRE